MRGHQNIRNQGAGKGIKKRLNTPSILGYSLLLIGSVVLVYSTTYVSKIPAFIGLGLIFWGTLFLFIKTNQYVKKELLDAEIIPSLKIIDNMITELGYKGKGIYISPGTLRELTSSIIFVPYNNDRSIPSPEELSTEKIFHENPKGICLTPPGLDLASIIEEKIGVSLFTIDFDQLQAKLSNVVIGDLEIAREFTMEINYPIIHVRIGQHIFSEVCSEVKKLNMIYSNIGCPLSSSIACILTKALGKPIIIDRMDSSEKEKTMDIFYQILDVKLPAVSPDIVLIE